MFFGDSVGLSDRSLPGATPWKRAAGIGQSSKVYHALA